MREQSSNSEGYDVTMRVDFDPFPLAEGSKTLFPGILKDFEVL
eukprot:CAMPEP_0201534818 /NCGR_PEP_ID=MMETSP0161_2-20130828/57217_1 /ASSEMBLY_ACC=CAM_ASM_000251 /TAXON_ID=180227 /ORGANISM="Neoparamoeba aestuarina, Strain SoJaBio B1-5/56/2" /LENGTH=42 /DNA_ID= /DNA_START= /DNA_END= /DNA_ORIENTATION=